MKLSDLMSGKTPSTNYAGFAQADDYVLALGVGTSTTSPDDYLVAQGGITEHTGALSPQTQERQYIRTGQVTVKTGTARSFAVSGDRLLGDEFQDAILAHELKYGKGSDVIKPYVYFNILTGEGESGSVSIAVEDDMSGAAGESASFTVSLTSTAEPVEYTYVSA
jgi:hypothetical protein